MRKNLRDQTDEELMRLYQKGDPAAFEVLYSRYSSKVYGFLRSRLSSSSQGSLVDDVFQATFMKLHRSREAFDPQLKFAPWLFTICKTTMLDALKGQGRRNEVELGDAVDTVIDAATGTEATESPGLPELSTLPQSQRVAIELRYGEDLSFDEIAHRLQTSPGNVRQMVSRGIRQLRNAFKRGQGD